MKERIILRILYFIIVSSLIGISGCSSEEDPSAPLPPITPVKQNILLADPFILFYEDVYYLYGTSDVDPNGGIPVYTSSDLVEWEGPMGKANDGNALAIGQSYGDNGFWAPHVLKYHAKFYMFYTANEHIAVAISDSPLGPFVQTVKKPLHEDIKEIDPHVFIDDDGKKYLYFVRFDNGNKTYGAVLNDDLQSIQDSTTTLCIRQSQDWEIASGALWPVTEAPSLIKHNNSYYLFYTANDFRHPNYNVGFATSSSPLGPWDKNEDNPIMTMDEAVPGTGGAEFIVNNSNDLLMFYHAHYSAQTITPRKVVYSKVVFSPHDGSSFDLPIVDNEKKYPEVER